MSDDLDSRIFFTLKNHVILQCVLKYLDVVGKIQFLTFLKLNRGWSYKDNIITVGENWDLVFLLLCFFSTPKQTLKQNKPFQKCEFLPKSLHSLSTSFKPMVLQSIFDKTQNSEMWKVRKSEGWEPDQGSPACPAGHLQHRPSQDSFYYSALQNVFFNCDFLPYHF